MPAAEVHTADIGTIFRATITDQDAAVDISSASVRQLKFLKPSGVVLTKTAVLTGAGTDGQMQYVSIAGDLDESGLWSAQAYLEIGTGKWHSDWFEFRVYANVS